MILSFCPRCRQQVILSLHFTLGLEGLFEPRPFALGEVEPPEELVGSSALARWEQELPWRLGLGYLLPDHSYTTYDMVQKRAKSKPYPHPWWARHECATS